MNCISLETIIFKEFNGYNIANMEYMFSNCTSLKNISLALFKNTYKVQNMSHMFENCSSIKKMDASKFNITNVEDISSMFSGCELINNNHVQ